METEKSGKIMATYEFRVYDGEAEIVAEVLRGKNGLDIMLTDQISTQEPIHKKGLSVRETLLYLRGYLGSREQTTQAIANPSRMGSIGPYRVRKTPLVNHGGEQ